MSRYRIYRLRSALREAFRWQPHTSGLATIKAKDYEPDGDFEALTSYALWTRRKADGCPLLAGDVLETVMEDGTQGDLQIFKYIGFEPAKWWIPEPKPELKDGAPDEIVQPPPPSLLSSHSG